MRSCMSWNLTSTQTDPGSEQRQWLGPWQLLCGAIIARLLLSTQHSTCRCHARKRSLHTESEEVGGNPSITCYWYRDGYLWEKPFKFLSLLTHPWNTFTSFLHWPHSLSCGHLYCSIPFWLCTRKPEAVLPSCQVVSKDLAGGYSPLAITQLLLSGEQAASHLTQQCSNVTPSESEESFAFHKCPLSGRRRILPCSSYLLESNTGLGTFK